MIPEEIRHAEEWLKKQHLEVEFHFPDRQSDEPSATQEQLAYIRRFLPKIEEAEIANLGKWQAEKFIEEINAADQRLTQEMLVKYIKEELPLFGKRTPMTSEKARQPQKLSLSGKITAGILGISLANWLFGENEKES